ncbi:ornithine cyclodeaminase/alanine dehydrogenase-like protein (mu-crystallin family) [Streptomyces rishiriensis]|uniref:Ornithine cyclodeaminase/alanine dehydrogenase-like protein (Mu-crystallin family) n=1 Tax=Streptomyces rishiriensis TaxID=68264 RepID=A0ABU0NG20_STRRH|nr:ornithine cyclodeaminase/alanine dehydrogenase-like protein (mu-crystallin family) [Streptomyces rishiriensis]
MIGGPAYFGPQEIRSTVGYRDVLEPVAAALRDYSRGLGDSPVAVFAPAGPEGDVHVKSAWLPGRQVFTVKVASWFQERARRGGTPASGVIAVFDATTGDLRALLDDEHHLSDVRTAAAGALGARMMARPDSRVLGVIGAGTQAYLQTRSLWPTNSRCARYACGDGARPMPNRSRPRCMPGGRICASSAWTAPRPRSTAPT